MKAQLSKCRKARPLEPESGIALITVLFLLITMTILGLTMVASVNSDMMINGYYGNSRSAYYAADSGLNIARQYLVNQLQLQVNMNPCLGWGASAASGCTSAPLSSTANTTALTNLKSGFANFSSGRLNVANQNLSGVGNAVASWPSSFIIQDITSGAQTCTNSFVQAAGSPVATPSLINANLTGTYTYSFNYVLCATGTAAASSLQRAAIKESGTLMLVISAQDTAPPTFAGYGQFVANQNSCPGSYLTPGTYTGPTYTNGAWTLGATSVPYIFTNTLSSTASQIYYYGTNGHCSSSTSTNLPGVPITFEGAPQLKLSAPAITPPSNSYSQAWAVLDGLGIGEGSNAPSNANLNAVVKNVSATAYPSSGTSSGVYLPYYLSPTTGQYTLGYLGGTNGTTPEQSGGIYVQGNASIVLTPGSDTSGNPTQKYTITQGATVTTVTTNIAANTTTFSNGTTTKTIVGVPENLAATPGQPTPGTMVYVNGTISGLSGPTGAANENAAAIQNNVMVTIAGSSDINITGNILYATEPVTKSTADTLLLQQTTPATNTQVLGVFTANGSIILNSPYSDKNLETDGSLAAIGSSSTCGTSTCGFKTSNTINTWTNVGGQIQSNEFVCSITTANTYYDQRFSLWNNFFPPWFPSTSTNPGSYVAQAPNVTPTQQRSSWSWIAAQ